MGTRLVEHTRCSFTPYTQNEPHLLHPAPSKPAADCFTCLGCKTGSRVESTMSVSGSPANSSSRAHRRGSRKRLSFLTRRWKEDGWKPTMPGNRCEKNRSQSLRKERSLSTPRSCCKSARARTSESESFLRDS